MGVCRQRSWLRHFHVGAYIVISVFFFIIAALYLCPKPYCSPSVFVVQHVVVITVTICLSPPSSYLHHPPISQRHWFSHFFILQASDLNLVTRHIRLVPPPSFVPSPVGVRFTCLRSSTTSSSPTHSDSSNWHWHAALRSAFEGQRWFLITLLSHRPMRKTETSAQRMLHCVFGVAHVAVSSPHPRCCTAMAAAISRQCHFEYDPGNCVGGGRRFICECGRAGGIRRRGWRWRG